MSTGQPFPLSGNDIVWGTGEQSLLAELRPRWPADFSIFVQFKDEAQIAGFQRRLGWVFGPGT
jgi:hypothetical protein